MDTPCSRSISNLLCELETLTHPTNLTVQDILDVARYLLYRPSSCDSSIRTRSRENLKPLVIKYGIGDRTLRAIFKILTTVEMLDLRPRISRMDPRAALLLEYLDQMPSGSTIPKEIWPESEQTPFARLMTFSNIINTNRR